MQQKKPQKPLKKSKNWDDMGHYKSVNSVEQQNIQV